MSLLSNIWDAITAWVRAAIDAATAEIRRWVNGLIAGARAFAENLVKGAVGLIDNARAVLGAAVTALQGAWNHFVTKTLPDLWAGIQNAVAAASKVLAGAIADVQSWVGNLIGGVQSLIAKTGEGIRSWVSNLFSGIPGIMDQRIRGLVPVDFIRDPLGYLQAAFLRFVGPWIAGILRSVAEGIDAGTREAEEEIERA